MIITLKAFLNSIGLATKNFTTPNEMKIIMQYLLQRCGVSQNNDNMLLIYAEIFIELSNRYYASIKDYINELALFSFFLVNILTN